MKQWTPMLVLVLVATGFIGCADQNVDVAEGPDPRLDDEMGWYRSATYEFDGKTGQWKLVESERGIGWSPDDFHERLEGLWGDLDDDR